MTEAEAVVEVWESSLQGKKSYGAYGPRDVLILVSSENLRGEDIVPRKEGCLTKEDRKRLKSQGIPEECWHSDASIIEARYRREEDRFEVRVLGHEEELKAERVKGEIKALMNNTTKPGVVLHYIGPGKKNTGDWCFQDGYIKFGDIIDGYMEYFHARGKCLEVVSDCSYSGKWIIALQEFLDGVGVQPCGHSAQKANILLKLRTSCLSHQIPYTMLYSTRGRGNDKNTGAFYVERDCYTVEQGQNIKKIDNTFIRCKKDATIEDPCSLPEDYTWKNYNELDRLRLVRGGSGNRKAWYYLLLVDDDETIEKFEEAMQIKTSNINLKNFGQIIKSGFGEDPPENVKEWMKKKYPTIVE